MDISDPKILQRLKDLGGGSDNLSEKLALLTNEMAKAEKNIENAKNAQRGGAAITKQIQRDDSFVNDTTDFFLGLLPSFTQAGNGGAGRQQNRVSGSEARDLLFELSSLTEGAYKVDKDELTSRLFSQENPYVLDPATNYKERFKDYQEFENYTSQRVGELAKQQELDKLLKDSQVMYDLFQKYSDINAKSLKVNNATAHITGSGDITAHAKNLISVKIVGSGDVHVNRDVATINKKVVGSGSVSKY